MRDAQDARHPMEVETVFDHDRRSTRGVGALSALLLALVLVVAACGSSTVASSGTLVGSAVGANPSTVPVALAAPTATPPATPAVGSSNPSGNSAVDAGSLQAAMVSVIKQVTPSVVVIETDSGLGSGVIYNTAGDIVTNYHVVGTSTTFQVTLSNGKSYNGTLVGSYPPDDIAVIKITAPGLTPAVFGDSSQLSVGDFVLAMGNPLGLQSSVTEGIVSALGRQVSEPTGNTLPDVIQTSAAINPGNSGGALVDLEGQVVGIPTLAATDPQIGGSAPGIGFAISSNRARTIADQLIASGHVTNSGRAYLGVEIMDTSNGVGVYSIVSGGPAATAGIKAGDLILSINGQATPDTATLSGIIATLKPGAVVTVVVQHSDGTKATLSVTLGQLPG
jgi:S1-C subfamily serine protease